MVQFVDNGAQLLLQHSWQSVCVCIGQRSCSISHIRLSVTRTPTCNTLLHLRSQTYGLSELCWQLSVTLRKLFFWWRNGLTRPRTSFGNISTTVLQHLACIVQLQHQPTILLTSSALHNMYNGGRRSTWCSHLIFKVSLIPLFATNCYTYGYNKEVLDCLQILKYLQIRRSYFLFESGISWHVSRLRNLGKIFADGNIPAGFEEFQIWHTCNDYCQYYGLSIDDDLIILEQTSSENTGLPKHDWSICLILHHSFYWFAFHLLFWQSRLITTFNIHSFDFWISVM